MLGLIGAVRLRFRLQTSAFVSMMRTFASSEMATRSLANCRNQAFIAPVVGQTDLMDRLAVQVYRRYPVGNVAG